MKKSLIQCSVLQRVIFSLTLSVVVMPVMAEDLALRLYQESGMQIQLQSIPESFDQGFQQFAKDIPEQVLKDMIQIGKDSFDEPAMRKIIIAHLKQKLTQDELKKLLDWYSTKTGKKVTELENAVSTPEGQKKLTIYAEQLANSQPDEAYIGQIQQLAVASKAVDLAVELAANMQFTMGAGIAMATANGESVNLNAIAAEIENAKPQLQQQISQYVLVSMLFTYRDLPSQELKSYIKFVSSPLGTSYYAALFGGVNEAFGMMGKKYGKALVEYFEQAAKQSKT
jgi:hypothetical protein